MNWLLKSLILTLIEIFLFYDFWDFRSFNKIAEPQTSCKLKKKLLLDIPTLNNGKIPTSPSMFQQILNSTPTSIRNLGDNSPSLFTFENANQEEISSILLSNKRGFGKGWDAKLEILTSKTPVNPSSLASGKPILSPLSRLTEKFDHLQLALTPKVQEKVNPVHFTKNSSISLFSKRLSKQFSKDLTSTLHPCRKKPIPKAGDSPEEKTKKNPSPPHLKSSESLSKHQDSKSINSVSHSGTRSLSHKHNFSTRIEREVKDLRSFVSGLVEKKLGLKTKLTPNVLQYKKPIKRNEKSCIDFSLLEDSQILSTGYLKYQNDIGNKLKISKIIVNHHKRTRKDTQIFFPALKRMKNPED
jgi:hypothetical protein